MTPRVSVAVPTYNSAAFLPAALDSIFGQSFRDFEVIVVDDGSTDDTREVLVPYRDRIRYEYQDNQGIGEARNRALQLATGEFVAFLDSDDLWEPEHLRVKVEVLCRLPGLGAVFGEFRVIDESGAVTTSDGTKAQFKVFERLSLEIGAAFQEQRTLDVEGTRIVVSTGEIFDTLFLGNFILPTSLVMRRTSALDVGEFKRMRTQEDYEYLLRFARRYPFAFVREPLVRYRRHPDQLTSFTRLESILLAAHAIVDQYEDEFRRSGRADVFARRKAGLSTTLGTVYLRQGRTREARAALADGIKRMPRDVRAYAHYALSFVPHPVLAALGRW